MLIYWMLEKKAEHRRIDAFEMWCWRRFLRVPWIAGDQTSSSWRKSVLNIHRKDWCWSWSSSTWQPNVKSWLIGKDPDAGQDWRQEEKGTTEDEMVGWPHRLDGLEFEQAPGIGDGQGSLECCSPWGHKELDMTERLNWTELMLIYVTTFTRKNDHTYKPLSSNGLYIVHLQEIYVKLIIDDKQRKYKIKSIVQNDS